MSEATGVTVKCYYKKASEVDENETKENIEGYMMITLNEELEGTISNLEAGETYKIKIVADNGRGSDWYLTQETTELLVTSIQIEGASVVGEGREIQLTAKILPETAKNQEVIWESSNSETAKVSETGLVTGVNFGFSTIITATAKDGSGVKASKIIEVVEAEADWDKMNRIAKAISNKGSSYLATRAMGETEAGETYDIRVGDIYKVKYNNEFRRVRVLGFNHDALVNTNAYGGNNTTAGISFEFYDAMKNNNCGINGSTSASGWNATQLRKDLNGYTNTNEAQSRNIGGEGANLSNSNYIKQVKKTYIKSYNNTATGECNDYLWLLSCGEIWGNGYAVGKRGYAIAKEGELYAYYRNGAINQYDASNSILVKTIYKKGGGISWWLRSPHYNTKGNFNIVNSNGACDIGESDSVYYLAPGFCI